MMNVDIVYTKLSILGNAIKDFDGVEVWKDSVERIFESYTDDIVEKVVNDYIDQNTFFPQPSKIREALEAAVPKRRRQKEINDEIMAIVCKREKHIELEEEKNKLAQEICRLKYLRKQTKEKKERYKKLKEEIRGIAEYTTSEDYSEAMQKIMNGGIALKCRSAECVGDWFLCETNTSYKPLESDPF